MAPFGHDYHLGRESASPDAHTEPPQKTEHTMNERTTIEQLRYRIDRYRSMGNGAMCQDLLSKLRQLEEAK